MKKILLSITLIFTLFFSQSAMCFSLSNDSYKFQSKPLPYSYDALEPYISKETMTLHHDKHYQGYVNKLNVALEKYPNLQSCSIYDLLTNLESIPDEISTTIKNNGGGVYNHEFFFDIMSPNKTNPSGDLKDAIIRDFGSFDNFKSQFTKSALNLFGSGWAWLVLDKDNKLSIVNTQNQDSPISINLKPVIGIDLWEHAYYLDYQNNRDKYIDNWFNVINWEKALENYKMKL